MSEKSSYAIILKSSSIMGGAAVITMLLGMVRTKFAAILLGTSGVGLVASFTAIQGLISTVAGFGLQSSAVRQIATAVASGDERSVSRTVLTLQRLCWLTGLIGALVLAVSSPAISQITFGGDQYTFNIALLSIVVFLLNLTGGQLALLQGMRRIGDIARANIFSVVIGTITTIGFYAWIGSEGIVPSLVISAAIQFGITRHFSRQIKIIRSIITWREILNDLSPMVRLGLAFMGASLLNAVLSYATIAMVLRVFNAEMVGIYSAAFALSGVFVNFVLSAMSADYYPRLAGDIHNKTESVRVINEQTLIGILMSLPGVLMTFIYAPLIVYVAYSNEFMGAVTTLQICLIGVFARVIAWPLGYVILATGEGLLFFVIELALTSLQFLIIFICLAEYGLLSIAWAFTGVALFNLFIEYYIAHRRLGFKYDTQNKKTIAYSLLAMIVAIMCVSQLEKIPAYLIGSFIVTGSVICSINNISSRLDQSHVINIIINKLYLHKRRWSKANSK